MATFSDVNTQTLGSFIQDTLYYEGYTIIQGSQAGATASDYPYGKDAYNTRRQELLKYISQAQKELEEDNSNEQEVYNEVFDTLDAISKSAEVSWEARTGQSAFVGLEGQELQEAVEERAKFITDNIPTEEGIKQVIDPPPNSGIIGLADQQQNLQESEASQQQTVDERLTAQCILIDIIPEISTFNADFRVDPNNVAELANATTICMSGDTNYFSSFINGSDKKAKFLDLTTAQLSSLTPVVKLYKVIQQSDGKTKDYLIPFSTHSAWRSGLTTYGTIEDLLFEDKRERPMDVGLKSFSWAFEGSNPVSSRRDISAKLTLFSNNLNNLAETFNIYANDGTVNCFRYVDLLLRSGKKFKESKQYNPQYYTTKIEIGWKSENTDLFDEKELESLRLNTTTMLLTLVDHNFNFAQDGTLTLTLDYRAYFEGLLFSDGADILRTSDQYKEIEDRKQSIKDKEKAVSDEQDPEDPSDKPETNAEKELDKAQKEYANYIIEVNKQSYGDIIQHLRTNNQIYIIGIEVSKYNLFRAQISSTSDISTQTGVSDFVKYYANEQNGVVDDAIKNATDAVTGKEDGSEGYNPKLATLVPQEEGGYKYITYFYLGDLLNYVISKAYNKLSEEPNKPSFLFGSALYRSRSNSARIARVNIMDIPVSIEWFSEWFANTIISQKRTEYQLLYFLRDICAKLINNIMSSACDKSGTLKLKNKFNTVNFFVKKTESSNEDPIYNKKIEKIRLSLGDINVQDINEIIQTYAPQEDGKTLDTSLTTEYLAVYCYDASSPVSVNCDEDIKNGIYHFYFGRDRGLIKNINFTRAQTTGLRELNYVRESSGRGWEQLMTPYDVEMKMVGNNLFINGMMVFINPSGFGRQIGQPNETDSISYQLKLGGYHTIYRIDSTISTSGFETSVKARWVGSGTKAKTSEANPTILTNEAQPTSVATGGSSTQTVEDPAPTCEQYDSGFNYSINYGKAPEDPGTRVKPSK